MSKKLVFLCGARDFHAMDWYRSAKELLNDADISIVTDLIAGEGFEKIIKPDDKLYKLLILDYFLFCNPPETATTGSLNSINSYCEKWGDYRGITEASGLA